MAELVFDKAEFSRQLLASADAGPKAEPGLVDALRATAREDLAEIDYPDRKQEAWRYTPVSDLLGRTYRFAPRFEALQPEDLDEFDIKGLEHWRVVLVNGRFIPRLSSVAGLPSTVNISGLRDALGNSELQPLLRAGAMTGGDLFAAMNLAGLDDGLVIDVAAGTQLDRPIEVLHVSIGQDEPTLAQPRLVVRLNASAQARLIERYITPGSALYFNNVVVDVETCAGARLEHVRIQVESDQAYQVSRQSVRQAEDSHYALRSVVLGGAWSRFALEVHLNGEGASTDLKGLYLINASRFSDQHLKVNHHAPHCQSHEDFRGILNGSGRAVFDGNIVVQRDAQKTDAQLSNQNLMLSRNAEVDTKPQLEIFADDVKCSHGTTVGELDQNALFYLRSRGIGEERAKRMLCLGFAQDLFEDVEPEALARHVIAQIDRRLLEEKRS